jgi:hypothetical protein
MQKQTRADKSRHGTCRQQAMKERQAPEKVFGIGGTGFSLMSATRPQ